MADDVGNGPGGGSLPGLCGSGGPSSCLKTFGATHPQAVEGMKALFAVGRNVSSEIHVVVVSKKRSGYEDHIDRRSESAAKSTTAQAATFPTNPLIAPLAVVFPREEPRCNARDRKREILFHADVFADGIPKLYLKDMGRIAILETKP